MFGSFRFAIAFAVMLSHQAGLHYAGGHAVWGFYCLSGYLMTLVINGKYKGRLEAFLINRFLRIYPPYLAAAIATALALLWGLPTSTLFAVSLPNSAANLIANLAMIGGPAIPALIAPVWTLTVEVFWWALIGLGLSSSKRRTLAWAGLSVLYAVATSQLPFEQRYYGVFDASLPFAMGAMLHWFPSPLARKLWPVAVLLLPVNWGVHHIAGSIDSQGFYLNLLLCWWAIAGLSQMRSNRIDKALGALSYPIYLAHYPVAAFVAGALALPRGWPLFWESVPLVLVLSVALHLLVELPIERLRNKVRSQTLC